MLAAKSISRVQISKDELEKMSKEDLLKSWMLQEQFIDQLELNLKGNADQAELMQLRESVSKFKHNDIEHKKKEMALFMRLATKEQESQEYFAQIQHLKSQASTLQKTTLVDPVINAVFKKMKDDIEGVRKRLKETEEELNAWKFTPDSNTGKRLMAKCRLLHQENEDLGKNLSSGRFAKLEADLALQKSFNEEMMKTQSELDEFVMELDEDFEGLQTTICILQQQLRESKGRILALQKENNLLKSANNPLNHCVESEAKVTSIKTSSSTNNDCLTTSQSSPKSTAKRHRSNLLASNKTRLESPSNPQESSKVSTVRQNGAKDIRTKENGMIGQKRTNYSCPIVAPQEVTLAKRSKREHNVSSEPSSETLEVDKDTEVQVAQTLAQWATNSETKGLGTSDGIINKLCNVTLNSGKVV